VFLYEKTDDVVLAASEIITSIFSEFLQKYRGLKNRISFLKSKISETERLIKSTEQRIEEISSLIPSYQLIRNIVIGLGAFFLLLAMALQGDTVGISIGLFSLGLIVFGVILHGKIGSLRDELKKLRATLTKLKNDLVNLKEELARTILLKNSFKLPKVSIKAFKMFVPVGIIRNPLGRKYLLVPPWGDESEFTLAIVQDATMISEGLSKIVTGETLYVDSIIKEKDTGYKIVRSLKSLNLWDKVLDGRSPEKILEEFVFEGTSLIERAIARGDVYIRLEKLDSESRELLMKVFSDGFLGKKVPKGQYLASHIDVIKNNFDSLETLAGVVSELKDLGQYIDQAREISSKEEAYSSIVEDAVKNLIKETVPLDEEVLSFLHSSIFCKYCADFNLERYIMFIDLRRWIYDSLLGGVDKDPDIVMPHSLVADYVKEHWSRIEEILLRSLPLPGVRGDEPLNELKENYARGLRKYALPFTGADERLELKYRSPFEPVEIKCTKCGRTLGPGGKYVLSKLSLPVIEGYSALLAEIEERLYRNTENLRTSVIDSRRTKDERKMGLGVYQQTLQDYYRAKKDVEKSLFEVKEYKKKLGEVLVPLIAGETAVTVLEEDLARRALSQVISLIER